MVVIEFFHDAVCGWCYLLSPRLRKIAEKYPVKVVHRTFVLQRNEQEMVARFGSLKLAKHEILQHWEECKRYAETPELINVEGMRSAPFHYPTGYAAALYAKAIERIGGQQAHWDFFDAVQKAHLYESKNIADPEELNAIAKAQGFTYLNLAAPMTCAEHRKSVLEDKARANAFGISSIPSLVINNQKVVSQTLSFEQLEELICSHVEAKYAKEEK